MANSFDKNRMHYGLDDVDDGTRKYVLSARYIAKDIVFELQPERIDGFVSLFHALTRGLWKAASSESSRLCLSSNQDKANEMHRRSIWYKDQADLLLTNKSPIDATDKLLDKKPLGIFLLLKSIFVRY